MNSKWYGLMLLLLIVGAVAGCRKEPPAEKLSVVAPEAKVEKLAGGFKFTEGPAVDAEGNIFFTDIPNNRIHLWSLDGKLSTFRENSGGANGLFFDRAGNLLACEGNRRRLVSIDPQGKVTVLAEKYGNKKLNSPNDLWLDPKGGIYFTDPRYGPRETIEQDGEDVYYLSADRKKLIRVIDDMVRPNGVIGTADGKLLYVTDHGGNKTWVYRINTDGTLSGKKLFAPEGSDGMTMDNEGNVYLTTSAVSVYDSAGNRIETIEVPERPANVCFGGRDNQTLFITAQSSLYSVRMRVKGLPRICASDNHSSLDSHRTNELIRDPHFQNGFKVLDPKLGKKVVRGLLQWDGSKDEPIWELAQWSSKHSLAGAFPERLASGAVRFANAAKTVVVGPVDSKDADLVLGVDSRQEYNGRTRQKGEPWPHLLVEQRFVDCPSLTDLKELRFHIRARLRHSQRFETSDYDPHLHAAQFQVFITVQNLNKNSPGYGDFLWFGIPFYDDRDHIPRRHVSADSYTDKLIYNPGGHAYTTESMHDGRWVTIQQDLLPLVLDGLRTAWERDFLENSRVLSDYRIGGINMGWEIPGINKVELQVCDLSLKAVGIDVVS